MLAGVTYRNNIGKACDASDTALNPASSCGPPACGSTSTVPVGWMDPPTWNFRLRAGSAAINAGSATYASDRDRDRDRKLRNGVPDVGAYEF